MAGIDKIYGNRKQYFLLRNWLAKNKPKAVHYMYPLPFKNTDEDYMFCISNFGMGIDRFLYNNCPLDFVIERIEEQYGKGSIEDFKKFPNGEKDKYWWAAYNSRKLID